MSSHPLRVLVVDDERIIADTLTEIFRSQGFDCRAAYDGTAALTAAMNFVPDVLITDIVMPGMDGWEVAERYASLLPACRVILFSGHADPSELEERADRMPQSCEVYPKPISPQIFIERLQMESRMQS